MRLSVITMVLAIVCAINGSAHAEDAVPVSAADQQAIRQVVTSQLDAFRRDAGDDAYRYASPNIQKMFGSAAQFMARVRQAYPAVYRPRSFEFDRLVTIDGQIVQRVMLVGPDGAPALALYTMEREPDGTWRIDGCILTRPDKFDT